MLNHLQSDIRELLDLVQKAENYDATLAALRTAGKPIEPTQEAHEERNRYQLRITHLRDKWCI